MVDGKFGSSKVTLELAAPRNAVPLQVYAAAWQASGDPPAPVNYAIDCSTDGGKSWTAVVKNWMVTPRAPDPPDYWSQSFTWGDAPVKSGAAGGPIRVRFSNDGGKPFRKAEVYLACRVNEPSPTQVSVCWSDPSGKTQTATHTYAASKSAAEDSSWHLDSGGKPQALWVEMASK